VRIGSDQAELQARKVGPSLKKRVIFTLVLLVVSAAAVVGGSEVLVRLYKRIFAPRKIPLAMVNPHGTGSYRLLPNLDVTTRVEGRRVRLQTNSRGMPWREVSLEKPPGVRRVAFVGDSFTFGLWADSFEKSFVGVFDSLVSSRGMETLNFGVPGYGLDDMALQIQEDVLPFRPDLIVLVFYDGNDFSDTYLGTNKFKIVKGRLANNKENFREKVPEKYRSTPHEAKPRGGLLRRARAFFVAHCTICRTHLLQRRAKPTGEFRVKQNFVSKSFWSQVPYPPIAEQAKNLSLGELGRIDDLCRRHGARLFIAALPFRAQVYSRQESGPDYDIGRPQVFVERFARERGIPYLDLLPLMRRHVRESPESIFVSHDPHLNNAGHRLVGEALAKWVEGAIENGRVGPAPADVTTPHRQIETLPAEERP
jgi:lysophospholipase L1-like esterase